MTMPLPPPPSAPVTGATCGLIDADAPWRWMRIAVGMYRRAWPLCAGYGLVFTLIGAGLGWWLAKVQLIAAIPVVIGGFGLVGPLMAAGLYALARADLAGQRVRFGDVLWPRAQSPGQFASAALLLLIAFFIWILIAFGLYIVAGADRFASMAEARAFLLTTAGGLSFLMIGTLIGGLIAVGIFAISVFSLPLMMDRRIDFLSAAAISIRTVARNWRPMALWAWIIAVSLAVGAATLLAGFIVLFPLLGLATWVGYVDAFGGGLPEDVSAAGPSSGSRMRAAAPSGSSN